MIPYSYITPRHLSYCVETQQPRWSKWRIINAWCRDNIGCIGMDWTYTPGPTLLDPLRWYFKSQESAVLFQLTWGLEVNAS